MNGRRVVLATYRFFGVAAKGFYVIVFTAICSSFCVYGVAVRLCMLWL
jgi:hypothetical protein